jgi:hypothetical protein
MLPDPRLAFTKASENAARKRGDESCGLTGLNGRSILARKNKPKKAPPGRAEFFTHSVSNRPMIDSLDQIYGGVTTVYILVLCVIFAASFSYVFDSKVNRGGDNAKYYLLGKSISQGKGYVDLNSPGEPPTSAFPPGYPLLMSPMLFFTQSIVAQKVLNGFFLLGSALLLFVIAKWVTKNELLAFSISVLTVVNFHLLKFSNMMMSEASFLFFSLLSVLFLMKSGDDKPVWKSWYFYTFLIALSFSFHIRTQGIALVGGVLFFFLFTRQWTRFSLTTVGFVLLALPWRFRNHIQGLGSSRYIDQLFRANPWRPEKGEVGILGLLQRTFEQGKMLITKAIPDSVFNFITADYQEPAGGGEWLIGILVLGVLLYGFWHLGQYRLFFLGYFLASFVIVASWSATVDNRYLVTIIPFLQFGLFYGAYSLVEKIGFSFDSSKLASVGILCLCLFMLPRLGVLNARAERGYHKAYLNYYQIADELGRKVGCNNTLISCRKPNLFYLFSGCYTTRYHYSKDDTAVIQRMVDKGVDYVVLAQLGYSSTGLYLLPAIKKNSSLFRTVIQKKKPNTYLFKFRRGKAEASLQSE